MVSTKQTKIQLLISGSQRSNILSFVQIDSENEPGIGGIRAEKTRNIISS
jgi:hypothetical protein